MKYNPKFVQSSLFSFNNLGIEVPPEHDLIERSNSINWIDTLHVIEECYSKTTGRNSLSLRLMTGLEIAKSYFKGTMSDEDMVSELQTNIALAYLCGLDTLLTHTQLPNSSSMTKFRNRLTPEVTHKIEEISVLKSSKKLSRKKRRQVSGDTTVVPSQVAYPTDIGLMGNAVKKTLLYG